MSPSEPARGPFRVPIRVRYEETDAAGVVYYANYLRYFEVARVEGLRALGMPIRAVEERGVLLPVVHAECSYKRPAHVDDLLEVLMWFESPGRSSFGFTYEVRRDDELLAKGRTRHAVIDRKTRRPLRIEGWMAEVLDGAGKWTRDEKAAH
jgi:acyl-CoA thioester hydrolase